MEFFLETAPWLSTKLQFKFLTMANKVLPELTPAFPSDLPVKEFLKNILNFNRCIIFVGLTGGAGGKEPACQCRRCKGPGFHPWVGKIPWRRAWQLTPVLLPEESHGQRSLVCYSLQGCMTGDLACTHYICNSHHNPFLEHFYHVKKLS